jgi:hypothetical protein
MTVDFDLSLELVGQRVANRPRSDKVSKFSSNTQ